MWIRKTWLFESCFALWVVLTALGGGLLMAGALLLLGHDSEAATVLGFTFIGASIVLVTCWLDFRKRSPSDPD